MFSSQLEMIVVMSIGLLNLLAAIHLYMQSLHQHNQIKLLRSALEDLKYALSAQGIASSATSLEEELKQCQEPLWRRRMWRGYVPSESQPEYDHASKQAGAWPDTHLPMPSRQPADIHDGIVIGGAEFTGTKNRFDL